MRFLVTIMRYVHMYIRVVNSLYSAYSLMLYGILFS